MLTNVMGCVAGQENRIDILPDDVLLEIFDFYVKTIENRTRKWNTETWQTLIHVCRRWRSLVFQLPRRLNLRLYCTPETPTKDRLDIWPALPILIGDYTSPGGTSSGDDASPFDTDNLTAALGQSSRVCDISLTAVGSQWESVLAAMQVPFPELTDLQLNVDHKTSLAIPDSFLGGSAPILRYFSLHGIPFPGLPKVLSTANHLVYLRLWNIPHSGYISPKAIATLISVSSSLRVFFLIFESPESRPDWENRSLLPPKRSILPALDFFRFQGVTEYLEDLLSHIDTPQLETMYITLLNQIDFEIPRLSQFINRSPILGAPDKARVEFCDYTASVKFRYRTSHYFQHFDDLQIHTSCSEPGWQPELSSIGQLWNSSFPPLCRVEDLYIYDGHWGQVRMNDGTEDTLYRGRPSRARWGQSNRIVAQPTEYFRELKSLEELGLLPENIGWFVAARQLSGHPIVISNWEEHSSDMDW